MNDVTSLPNGTTLLRFDLYDGNGNLILSSNATVSDVFEIDEVDGDVRSTTVTAFDEDGFPIGQVTVPSEVVLGADTDIDLSNAVFTPITFDALTATLDPVELGTDETLPLALQASFSNGATVALPSASFPQSAAFVSNDTDVVTVNSDGVLTGGEAGNTTVTAKKSLGRAFSHKRGGSAYSRRLRSASTLVRLRSVRVRFNHPRFSNLARMRVKVSGTISTS